MKRAFMADPSFPRPPKDDEEREATRPHGRFFCVAIGPRRWCVLQQGHTGDHIATDEYQAIVARWPQTPAQEWRCPCGGPLDTCDPWVAEGCKCVNCGNTSERAEKWRVRSQTSVSSEPEDEHTPDGYCMRADCKARDAPSAAEVDLRVELQKAVRALRTAMTIVRDVNYDTYTCDQVEASCARWSALTEMKAVEVDRLRSVINAEAERDVAIAKLAAVEKERDAAHRDADQLHEQVQRIGRECDAALAKLAETEKQLAAARDIEGAMDKDVESLNRVVEHWFEEHRKSVHERDAAVAEVAELRAALKEAMTFESVRTATFGNRPIHCERCFSSEEWARLQALIARSALGKDDGE